MNGWTAAKHNLKEEKVWAEGIEFTTRSVAGTGGVHADSPAWTAQIIARKRLFESHCATDESGKVR